MYLIAQYATRRIEGPIMNDWGRGDSWIHALMGLLIVLIIAGVAVYLIRSLTQKHQIQTEVRDPLDIANERFAKGEITKDEFNDIKKELN
jgi:putative membrane protein